MTMTPTLAEAFRRAIAKGRNMAPNGMPVTMERMTRILGNGHVEVLGVRIPVAGEGLRALRPGMKVAVAWEKGRPVVAIAHSARRSGAPVPLPTLAGGIVEELFTNDFVAPLEVWIRDETRFEAIEFAEPGNDPSSLGFTGGVARWGKGSADLITFDGTLSDGDRAVAVYRLNRSAPNEPFEEGEPVQAILVQLYNLTDDPFEFGTIAVTASDIGLTQTGVASGPLKYVAVYSQAGGPGAGNPPWPIRIETTTRVSGVAPNGDLLVNVQVTAQAPVGEFGRTDALFALGSILVNVTRSQVLANYLAASLGATIHVSPVGTAVCTALGISDASTSEGGATADAGEVTVLSLSGDDPAQAGIANNYVLMQPAFAQIEPVRIEDPPGVVIGFHACVPPRAALTLSIRGEFEALNAQFAEFPGSALGTSEFPHLQGSRTMLIWAPYISGEPGGLEIRDLETGLTRPVAGDPDRLFGGEAFPPWGNTPANDLTIRPLVLLQAGMIYSPRGSEAPFDDQFFYAFSQAAADGIEGLDVDAPVEDSDLEEQAALLGIEQDDVDRFNLLDSGSGDVQVLNSERLADRQSESVVL